MIDLSLSWIVEWEGSGEAGDPAVIPEGKVPGSNHGVAVTTRWVTTIVVLP